MREFLKSVAKISVLTIAAAAMAGPVFADKPDWAGRDRGNGHERNNDRGERGDRGQGDRERGRPGFDEARRQRVHEYYAREMKRGHCPPGLRKKHNGCMPPGQARKWKVGERLPKDVAYHDLTPQLRVEVGVPPAGYRYVQVANDILMIAAGTGMVVDAINDLGR
jgi:Ni/Co efflux regulator RcnB